MRARLDSDHGKACYAQRSRTIEPVFGQVKTIQDGRRFSAPRLRACQAEWKLLCGHPQPAQALAQHLATTN